MLSTFSKEGMVADIIFICILMQKKMQKKSYADLNSFDKNFQKKIILLLVKCQKFRFSVFFAIFERKWCWYIFYIELVGLWIAGQLSHKLWPFISRFHSMSFYVPSSYDHTIFYFFRVMAILFFIFLYLSYQVFFFLIIYFLYFYISNEFYNIKNLN